MKNWRISYIRNNKIVIFCLLLAMTFGSFLLNLSLGAVRLPIGDVLEALSGHSTDALAYQIVILTRLPRALACLLVGGALAVSGVVIQSVLANPLAAPNIIGVNAGAGLMVAAVSGLVPVFFPKMYVSMALAAPFAAFLGAMLGVFLVVVIAERTGASKITLVLAGVAISGIFNAAIDAIVTVSDRALMGYTDFRIGGFSNITMEKIGPVFWAVLAVMLVLIALADELELLTLGSDVAHSLGLSVRTKRFVFLGLAAALAGASVSLAGLLGFVGLIVPHIMRRLVGEQSRFLIICSFLGGACLVSICDLAARTAFRPFEIPVGIVLSLVGGPFFLWLLFRQRGGRAHD